jgi:hypothetical protein
MDDRTDILEQLGGQVSPEIKADIVIMHDACASFKSCSIEAVGVSICYWFRFRGKWMCSGASAVGKMKCLARNS